MPTDMYAFTTTEKPSTEVDFPRPRTASKLHQWSEHGDLCAWMDELYRRKGGSCEPFELMRMALTYRDLTEMEYSVLRCELNPESNCCYEIGDDYDAEDDLEFIRKARAAIGEGLTVFYLA